jgi:hypothetical protein
MTGADSLLQCWTKSGVQPAAASASERCSKVTEACRASGRFLATSPAHQYNQVTNQAIASMRQRLLAVHFKQRNAHTPYDTCLHNDKECNMHPAQATSSI